MSRIRDARARWALRRAYVRRVVAIETDLAAHDKQRFPFGGILIIYLLYPCRECGLLRRSHRRKNFRHLFLFGGTG